ncbi:enoyl-CoA hydratase-related protein [Sciscionella marina]|uniref:enoyl-CoA hydratase-related protein n=1 Tax=Sciscionella marina TaxID=508770 RepID=UPI000360FD50|nr:enoyl-CoA hydratase-related protein [Sciscionella marina]
MAASQDDVLLVERHGAVRVLVFNRPERLNAWTLELERRYFAELAEADADPAVRAIVVTGAGRGFCAGADLEGLNALGASAGDRERLRDRPVEFPLGVSKPLIAAVNGAAAGLGMVQALYCDLRFTTAEAKFTTSFARRGLVAEYGSAWLLPRLIGRGAALDLLLSGRAVRGAEAVRIGLAERVCEPANLLAETIAYARDLAENCSPTAMRIIKEQVRAAAGSDFAAALAESKRLMQESFERPDFVEGVRSYLESRAPEFPPLGS